MTLFEEIQGGENAALEFKEARPKDSLKFTKTVVAFANGKGGRLIFGIEDGTRNIVGVPRDKVFSEMDAIVNAISETCTPSISPDVKIANVCRRLGRRRFALFREVRRAWPAAAKGRGAGRRILPCDILQKAE